MWSSIRVKPIAKKWFYYSVKFQKNYLDMNDGLFAFCYHLAVRRKKVLMRIAKVLNKQ